MTKQVAVDLLWCGQQFKVISKWQIYVNIYKHDEGIINIWTFCDLIILWNEKILFSSHEYFGFFEGFSKVDLCFSNVDLCWTFGKEMFERLHYLI